MYWVVYVGDRVGKSDMEIFGEMFCGRCCGDKGSRGLLFFQVIVDVIDGLFGIENIVIALTLKIKKVELLGAEKSEETL